MLSFQEFNADRLAEEYELELRDTKNILEYFQSFKVIPVIDSKDMPRIGGDKQRLQDKETLQDKGTPRIKDSWWMLWMRCHGNIVDQKNCWNIET